MTGFTKAVLSASMLCSCLHTAENDVPSSPRSREAVNRVKPRLVAELTEENLAFGAPIFIRILKEEKVLEAWVSAGDSFMLFKTYPVCTYGSGGLGPKLREGDGRAPEGFYYVTPSRLNPFSTFHLSFNLGYPNQYDRCHRRTGSALMVHGGCASIGCYAITDAGIEEVYALADAALRNGQPFFRVHIFPFRMTPEKMREHAGSEWHGFWMNLKEGYDFFEKNGRNPPDTEVREGRYVFSSTE